MFGRLKALWEGRPKTQKEVKAPDSFRRRYALFQELLASNAENLDLIADIEEKLRGERLFGMSYVRSIAARSVFHAHRMAKALQELSGGKYSALFPVLEKIREGIREELDTWAPPRREELVLPYSKIGMEELELVGGKNAHLGEARNKLGIPVPEGFAITTWAFFLFMETNELKEEIQRLLMELSPDSLESLMMVSEEIQRRILLSQVPQRLAEAILTEYESMAKGERPRISMRSSATSEDTGGLSFAGQYLSSLNVPPEKLLETYKVIIGSLYTPRAISYRLHKGIPDEDQAMAVACLRMVDALASGVGYSFNPSDPEDERIFISAVWGLGPYAVEGVVTPDVYLVERGVSREVETRVSQKPVMLVCVKEGGLREIPVDPSLVNAPCLERQAILELARYIKLLEDHFGTPQDIEWALGEDGTLYLLQCRPLSLSRERGRVSAPPISGRKVLLEGGEIACPGVGYGLAFHVRSEEDLSSVPPGAVLIARQPSPKLMVALPKASGVLSDYGSATGHLASLAREFSVPTIVGLKEATSRIPPGTQITVDANSGRVYEGRVDELIQRPQDRKVVMAETPVYRLLERLARWITPLNLVDPQSPDFTPDGCKTIHDVMRFVHEISYSEMFRLSEMVNEAEGRAFRLRAQLPIDLHIIDLGGGLEGDRKGVRDLELKDIRCIPLRALLRGMTHEGLRSSEPRPVDLGGFISVLTEQLLTNPLASERFGDRSYAIISDKYMNFSSRVGYHYGVLDTYCGNTTSKNYITFSFQGGAADDVRRNRRARAIAKILKELDFSVDVTGDRTVARLQKRPMAEIEEKLDLVGRLLVFTRQMDMLMHSDEAIDMVVRAFSRGDYSCRCLFEKGDTSGDSRLLL
jgi:pyruvate,water dikinase